MKRKDLVLLILSLVLAVFGLTQLIGYIAGLGAEKQTQQQMREIYHAGGAEETGIPTMAPATPSPEPADTETPTAAGETVLAEVPAKTEAPAAAAAARLKRTLYPENPGLAVSQRFRELRKGNRDIVGWITAGKYLDEAVTQRDNEYYMNHDASGRENVGGAIFLDESVSLRFRPYALVLYGHNMRDESRFGWLHRYGDRAFYRSHLFISFNTVYEEGRYVVFSEGTVSTDAQDPRYLDLFGLASLRLDEREQAIGVLQVVSELGSGIDVRTDDQILLLVTCVDKDTDRRIVAARRLREGESEAGLAEQAGRGIGFEMASAGRQ